MTIFLKNKHTLQINDFNFHCCIGEKGLTKRKNEGDKKTPIGTFRINSLYYRGDRMEAPKTKLKQIRIKKSMGWCDDIKSPKHYNSLMTIRRNIKHEKLFRKDSKYDLLIPIEYNSRRIVGKGSCIFIHLTKNYKSTLGCIALKKKDFLIMLKIIEKRTKIKIS